MRLDDEDHLSIANIDDFLDGIDTGSSEDIDTILDDEDLGFLRNRPRAPGERKGYLPRKDEE